MFQSGQPPPVECTDKVTTPSTLILFLLLLLALQLKEKARTQIVGSDKLHTVQMTRTFNSPPS